MNQCKHVRSGKRAVFATTRAQGSDDDGNAVVTRSFEVCARCFGPFLWQLFGKLPQGSALRLSRDGEGDLTMSWERAEPDEESSAP